ncbi:MAG TPA: hypothetical protein VF060_05485 [Trebonia sp.]
MPYRARRAATVAIALTVLLVVVGYAAYRAFERVTATPPAPGCQAGTGTQAVSLDTGQAGIAAIIAGVAARHELPRRAITIALATALQESDLENLPYGDRDSVGVFQQRPSQGWGTAADLQNPVYATTRFFAALVQIPRYTKIPVDQAAQDVQHSADGSAYAENEYVATLLSGDLTGQPPHAVTCWYTPAAKPRADVTQARQALRETFGSPERNGLAVQVSNVTLSHVPKGAGWAAASWLVTHAEEYQISEVRYASYEWKAADGNMGWQRDANPKGATASGIVAS